jgi:hypothetical protein
MLTKVVKFSVKVFFGKRSVILFLGFHDAKKKVDRVEGGFSL